MLTVVDESCPSAYQISMQQWRRVQDASCFWSLTQFARPRLSPGVWPATSTRALHMCSTWAILAVSVSRQQHESCAASSSAFATTDKAEPGQWASCEQSHQGPHSQVAQAARGWFHQCREPMQTAWFKCSSQLMCGIIYYAECSPAEHRATLYYTSMRTKGHIASRWDWPPEGESASTGASGTLVAPDALEVSRICARSAPLGCVQQFCAGLLILLQPPEFLCQEMSAGKSSCALVTLNGCQVGSICKRSVPLGCMQQFCTGSCSHQKDFVNRSQSWCVLVAAIAHGTICIHGTLCCRAQMMPV